MLIIKHRVNSIKELLETPKKLGIEIDLRSYKNDLILNHEPYLNGEKFDNFLEYYQHEFIILNIKEEGLEERILQLMKNHNIENYFFLDQSFPFLYKTSKNGEKRSALRLSEYESIHTVFSLEGFIDWVWIDFFTRFPLNCEEHLKLRDAGFNLCLVSPELQGHNIEKIKSLQKTMLKNNIQINAVCTKYPILWEKPNLFIST